MTMSQGTTAQKPKFSVAITTEGYKNLINNTLQDPKRAQRFTANIMAAVSNNPALQECDAGTILACAFLGESLELSPSPQLGHFYLVPFEDKKNNRKVATFILGYKGYIQLALRSGQYRKLDVIALKKGELVHYDILNEEITLNLMKDELAREVAETTGYYAYFEYMNGFRKTLYWSKEKMLRHAEKYSPAFGPAPARDKFPGRLSYAEYLAGRARKSDMWAYSSFWYKDFDGMAFKTMLRQLISKWGIMSTELQMAFESDNTIIGKNNIPEYIESDIPQIGMYTEAGVDVDAEAEPPEPGEIIEGEAVPPESNGQINIKDL